MPVLYGPFQSVLKDKNGEQLFYPRVLRTGNVSTSQISKEIAAYSSLSPGDVKNTLDNLVTVEGEGGKPEGGGSGGGVTPDPSV